MRDKIPFYIIHNPTKKDSEHKSRRSSEVDKINAIGSWTVKIIALLGMFVLSLIYDGYWLYVFFGIAAVLVGVELKTRFTNGGKK